ncbi:MAG TPA: hypothetical protein VM597_40630 [Gemmataceae bacterium]|jgi:hypothetical protein|nr:hypothetical protein [Gemmataceae bacterium]
MSRLRVAGLLALLLPAGCMTGPRVDNPLLVHGPVAGCDDAVLLAPDQAGEAYAAVFDRVLDVVDDHFPIQYANRYEGRVLGKPTIAPGFEQWWKPGSPDHYDRTLATLQAYRYRCEVRIREAQPSGYWVRVLVYKELKDYPTPARSTGPAIFGDLATVERDDFLIVDPDVTTTLTNPQDRWIPKGRETAIEQIMLRKLMEGP